jgi:hypothetical protein
MPIPTRARTSALGGYVTGHGVGAESSCRIRCRSTPPKADACPNSARFVSAGIGVLDHGRNQPPSAPQPCCATPTERAPGRRCPPRTCRAGEPPRPAHPLTALPTPPATYPPRAADAPKPEEVAPDRSSAPPPPRAGDWPPVGYRRRSDYVVHSDEKRDVRLKREFGDELTVPSTRSVGEF